MKTISLDLSTKSTGWAVYDENKLIDYGCITASSTDVIKRIHKITTGLKEIFSKYADCTKVIVEEVHPEQKQTNFHTHKVLMWLQASLVFLLHDDFPKAEIEYVMPNEWRKACGIHTGRGVKRNSLKEADMQFIKDTYGISTTNDDIADAIGIGHAYVNQMSNEINWE